jgi:hypothetical protein
MKKSDVIMIAFAILVSITLYIAFEIEHTKQKIIEDTKSELVEPVDLIVDMKVVKKLEEKVR